MMIGAAKAVAISLSPLVLAGNAAADRWEYKGPVEGVEPMTYAFISTNGDPQFARGSKISIARDAVTNRPGWSGDCTFDNCTVIVVIDGTMPSQGQTVTAKFSNDFTVTWTADQFGGMNNYSRVNMRATNNFVQLVRGQAFVDISFGDQQRRFSLRGSAKALDAFTSDIRVMP